MISPHCSGAVTKVSDVPIPSGREDINSNNKDSLKEGRGHGTVQGKNAKGL